MNLNSILYNLRKILKYSLFILIIILLIGIFFLLTSGSVHALTFDYNNTTHNLADFTESSKYYIGYDNGSYFLWSIRNDSNAYFYLNGQYIWINGACYLYNYVNGEWVYSGTSVSYNSMGLPAHVIYSTVDIFSDYHQSSVWWYSNTAPTPTPTPTITPIPTATPNPNPNNTRLQFTYDIISYNLPGFGLSTKFFVVEDANAVIALYCIDNFDDTSFFYAPNIYELFVSGTSYCYVYDAVNDTWVYNSTNTNSLLNQYRFVRFSTINIYWDANKSSIRWAAQVVYNGLYPYFRDYEDPDGVQNTLVTGETTSYFGFYVPKKIPQEGENWYTSKYTSYVKIVDTSSGATLEDLPNNQNVTFIDLNEWFIYPYGSGDGVIR